jgi:hypothetical protein
MLNHPAAAEGFIVRMRSEVEDPIVGGDIEQWRHSFEKRIALRVEKKAS